MSKRGRKPRLIKVTVANQPDPKIVAEAFAPLFLDWLARERVRRREGKESKPKD